MQLIPMTQAEFENYLTDAITDYAHDLDQAGGLPTAKAAEIANSEFRRLLPKGLDTPNHYVMKVVVDQKTVGSLWLFVNPTTKRAFIYDITINEDFRRHGYGRQAMLAAEKVAQEHGAQQIGLHVFGFNKPAQHLYVDLGYQISDLQMQKPL